MESPETPLKREFKLLATTDKKVVGLIEFKGQMILATSDGVYRLENDEFKPIRINDD